MRRPRFSFARGYLTEWLVVGICASLGVLVWFGYRAITEWQRTEELLADRRARDTVDLLATALSRDMRGVQNTVLSEWWEELTTDPPDDVRKGVASVFARYPYPESFFVWRRGAAREPVVFYNRSDRLPPWLTSDYGQTPFPVVIGLDEAVSQAVVERVLADGRLGRRFSVFETQLHGVRYQVVARLFYADPYRQSVDGVVGFTVNLPWARQHYFPDVVRQVARIGGGLPMAILDGSGQTVAGTGENPGQGPVARRWFPVLFIDPLLVGIDSPADVSCDFWTAQVRMDDDRLLSGAIAGTHRTMVFAGLAAVSLLVGLVLTVRASRASAQLAALRSEFVSTVTHELKTPIAGIRLLGETLVRSKIAESGPFSEYPRSVVRESKRLMRLVENLLAYARVTDLAAVYQFEAINLRTIVEGVVRTFRAQLVDGGFDLQVDIAPDVPRIRGDRTALTLAIDNLLDNAIRYSGTARVIEMRAGRHTRGKVWLEVVDRGIGISADELRYVTRRFFRGSNAGSGGSGLGLAIVDRIATDHGGTLEIVSAPDAGTTVRLVLPAGE